jgi:cyclin D3
MLHVIKEGDPRNQLEYQNQLMAVLKTNEVCVL